MKKYNIIKLFPIKKIKNNFLTNNLSTIFKLIKIIKIIKKINIDENTISIEIDKNIIIKGSNTAIINDGLFINISNEIHLNPDLSKLSTKQTFINKLKNSKNS